VPTTNIFLVSLFYNHNKVLLSTISYRLQLCCTTWVSTTLVSTDWCLQIGVYRLVSTDWCLQIGIYRLVSTDWCLQIGVYRLVSTDWCLQIGVYRLVSTDWCLQLGCLHIGIYNLGVYTLVSTTLLWFELFSPSTTDHLFRFCSLSFTLILYCALAAEPWSSTTSLYLGVY
jgi:hypothetical protein